MDIYFANKKIETICSSPKKAIKKYGSRNADILFRRLSQMMAAENLDELQRLPGHYHILTGNRRGEWACTIEKGLRLIFKVNEDGSIPLLEITEVTIVELKDYH